MASDFSVDAITMRQTVDLANAVMRCRGGDRLGAAKLLVLFASVLVDECPWLRDQLALEMLTIKCAPLRKFEQSPSVRHTCKQLPDALDTKAQIETTGL